MDISVPEVERADPRNWAALAFSSHTRTLDTGQGAHFGHYETELGISVPLYIAERSDILGFIHRPLFQLILYSLHIYLYLLYFTAA